jgi:hypothetical protein
VGSRRFQSQYMLRREHTNNYCFVLVLMAFLHWGFLWVLKEFKVDQSSQKIGLSFTNTFINYFYTLIVAASVNIMSTTDYEKLSALSCVLMLVFSLISMIPVTLTILL